MCAYLREGADSRKYANYFLSLCNKYFCTLAFWRPFLLLAPLITSPLGGHGPPTPPGQHATGMHQEINQILGQLSEVHIQSD